MPSRKDSSSDTVPQWRRFLIAAGTSRYKHCPEDDLPSVEKDLERVRELFCDTLHYENALPNLKINPKRDVLREALRDWIRKEDRNERDVVVIYYSGHGGIEAERHYLLTTDSDPKDLLDTAVPTEDLARRIASSSVQLVLLLIDTCYAGSGSGDIAKVVSGIRGLFSRENVGFFVIAAARPKEEARQGVFAEALTNVFYDERLAGTCQAYLLPTGVSTAINRYFRGKDLGQLTMVYDTYIGYEDPPFFPNPRYRPSIPAGVDLKTQRRLSSIEPSDLLLHWGPRARGVEIESQAGWYFTGRTRILGELVQWLKTPAAEALPQVITGGPGVGKSAVLARLVTMADPGYRSQARLKDADPHTIPPENCINVAIHAKGKTSRDIVRAISRATGAVTEDADELLRDLAGRSEPVTIVIDALDEAKEPETIADRVLRPMTPLPTIRLLIGTREELISSLGTHVEIKYLDREYHEPEDIRDYVKLRLLAHDEPDIVTPYRDKPDLARKVADVVAGRAKTVFLIARLICENLIQAQDAVDPQSDEWRNDLPDTVASAFGAYLNRFGVEEYRVRDLLLPLAYAEGEGLPWDNLWAPLASALSGRAYTDDDVAWVRDKAGAYIIEALQSGQSVYRLYHKALADYFHDHGLDEERHRRIAKALIASVPDGDAEGSKVWQEAHLYVLQHLSTHAAMGGTLSGLVRDPLYLLAAEPARLLPAIDRSISTLPSEITRVYKQTAHRLHDAPLEEKASYLELTARQSEADELADRIAQLNLRRPWSARWVRWSDIHSHQVLAVHHRRRTARATVAVGKLNNRPVVVSGCGDIRVSDMETDTAIGAPIKGLKSGVSSLTVTELNGRPIILSSGRDGIRMWELADGSPLGDALPGYTENILALAAGKLQERPVVVAGCADGKVRRWRLDERTLMPEPVAGHQEAKVSAFNPASSEVRCLVLGELAGRPVIVSGGYDKMIRIWDLDSGKPIFKPLTGHIGWIDAVAVTKWKDQPVIVSGGAFEEGVRIWDPIGRQISIHPTVSEGFIGNSAIEAIDVGKIEGQPVIVSGSFGGHIQFWNLPDGMPVGEPLTGHEGPVKSIVLTELRGRPVVVSGGSDGTVRIWHLKRGLFVNGRPGARRVTTARSLIVDEFEGHPVICADDSDWNLRILDLATGKLVRTLPNPVQIQPDPVVGARHALFAFGLLQGQLVLIVNEQDGIGIWDPIQIQRIAEPIKLRFSKGYVNSLKLAKLDGRPVVLVGSSAGELWVGDLLDRAPIETWKGDEFSAVAIGALDGRRLIAIGEYGNNIQLWKLSNKRGEGRLITHHEGYISSIGLGKLGERSVIVSAGSEGNLCVWNPDGKLLSEIQFGAPINDLAFGPGSILVVSTSKGIAVLEFK